MTAAMRQHDNGQHIKLSSKERRPHKGAPKSFYSASYAMAYTKVSGHRLVGVRKGFYYASKKLQRQKWTGSVLCSLLLYRPYRDPEKEEKGRVYPGFGGETIRGGLFRTSHRIQ